jgi:hypothetical protein
VISKLFDSASSFSEVYLSIHLKKPETCAQGCGRMTRKHFSLSFEQKVFDGIKQENVSEEIWQQI